MAVGGSLTLWDTEKGHLNKQDTPAIPNAMFGI